MNSAASAVIVAISAIVAAAVVILVTAWQSARQNAALSGASLSGIPGVCAFDLDNTVTCGFENAKAAVDRCRELGMRLAINTARPTRNAGDIDLVALGLSDVGDDFYTGAEYTCSFESAESFNAAIAETKVGHLEHLARKYSVPRARVVLFDDLESNVALARARGFSAVHANNPGCGIPADVTSQIDRIVGA